MTFRTRFAPSPTGPLHLGHAYSALVAEGLARDAGGDFLLRIEDIDQTRCRPEWEAQIYDDLDWLGLEWEKPVLRQSDRLAAYDAALSGLWERGLLYPCTCTRRDITNALSAPQEGVPTHGPDGLIYPGRCREVIHLDQHLKELPSGTTLRLNIRKALEHIPGPFYFTETGEGPNGETGEIAFTVNDLLTEVGDFVIARKEMGTSYHLSVVLDDTFQSITHVVRGQDLFSTTMIHGMLQALLGLPVPTYHHHDLVRDENGKRLAKRDNARSISTYRDEGHTAHDVRQMVGFKSNR